MYYVTLNESAKSRAWRACVLCVFACFACLRAHVLGVFACLRACMRVLPMMRAWRVYHSSTQTRKKIKHFIITSTHVHTQAH